MNAQDFRRTSGGWYHIEWLHSYEHIDVNHVMNLHHQNIVFGFRGADVIFGANVGSIWIRLLVIIVALDRKYTVSTT